MTVLGLAAIVDANPSWERTPWYLRLLGRPAWRSFRYVQGAFVYADTKPASMPLGVNKASNPMWRTGYSNLKQVTDVPITNPSDPTPEA